MFVPIIKLRRALAPGFVAAMLGCPMLSAQQAPAGPLRFEVRPWPELALISATGIAALVPELNKGGFPHATCAPCDPRGLWGVDRRAIGTVRGTPAAFSNLTLVAAIAGGGLLALHRRAGAGSAAQREDLAVYAQGLSATFAATNWIKVLARRPRPVLYTSDSTQYGIPSNGVSFPSGHSSLAFASAAAYASVLDRRGIAGRHKTEIAALFSLATATGVLRVAAHKHFPTDVAAGAVLGTLVGWLVPGLNATR